jgi:hypothetical protein
VRYKNARLVLCFLGLCSAGFADNMQWVSAGSNAWQGFYVGPYTAKDATTGQLISIFCIDYNHEIAPPMDWQANIVPFSASNFSQYQFGGSYPNILPGNTSNPANFAFQTNTAVSNGASVTANLSTSNGLDRYLELAWLVTQMETALTDQNSGLLSTAAMNIVLDIYQAADWLVFADSGPSEFSSGKTNLQDLESRITATGGNYAFNSTLGLWGSSSTGYNFQFAVDSALNSAENAVINQGWTPGLGWSVVTADKTWDAQNENGVPLQEFLTYSPPSQSNLNPVPEPSQIVLMFTVIALIALGAKRSGVGSMGRLARSFHRPFAGWHSGAETRRKTRSFWG